MSDRPQLYPLGHGDAVYDHLRKKQNATYHELGTLEPALSFFWDANFFFTDWASKLSEHCTAAGDPDAAVAVEALKNSYAQVYGILNRRRNLVQLPTGH
eukprot:SAG31_NODE_1715_length_7461_cov_2.903695_6_plen_99_part_00